MGRCRDFSEDLFAASHSPSAPAQLPEPCSPLDPPFYPLLPTLVTWLRPDPDSTSSPTSPFEISHPSSLLNAPDPGPHAGWPCLCPCLHTLPCLLPPKTAPLLWDKTAVSTELVSWDSGAVPGLSLSLSWSVLGAMMSQNLIFSPCLFCAAVFIPE